MSVSGRSPSALPQMLLTVLLSELFGLLVRHISLGLQVGLVSNQNDDLETQQKKASLLFHCSSWNNSRHLSVELKSAGWNDQRSPAASLSYLPEGQNLNGENRSNRAAEHLSNLIWLRFFNGLREMFRSKGGGWIMSESPHKGRSAGVCGRVHSLC